MRCFERTLKLGDRFGIRALLTLTELVIGEAIRLTRTIEEQHIRERVIGEKDLVDRAFGASRRREIELGVGAVIDWTELRQEINVLMACFMNNRISNRKRWAVMRERDHRRMMFEAAARR